MSVAPGGEERSRDSFGKIDSKLQLGFHGAAFDIKETLSTTEGALLPMTDSSTDLKQMENHHLCVLFLQANRKSWKSWHGAKAPSARAGSSSAGKADGWA